VATFLPGRSFRERWSINLRSHRKLLIIDGRVGFTGGMNVGDEYLGLDPAYGDWRDTQLKVRGPAVLQLQQVFAEDWYYATGEELLTEEYFPEPQRPGDVSAQVISAGPQADLAAFLSLMFAAITRARERVTLATSYFVPPSSLATALETAARQGVRVRLLVAKKANFLWTLLAGRSYFNALLDAGVEIYEYQDGFFHAKTLTVDGKWSLVGSANFDMRSLILNFEAGLVMYSERIARELEEQFERDLCRSTRVDPAAWAKRSTAKVLGEQFCRLFAPVL
jgi:cardiolipin synthase